MLAGLGFDEAEGLAVLKAQQVGEQVVGAALGDVEGGVGGIDRDPCRIASKRRSPATRRLTGRRSGDDRR